jgi:acyl-CoA synthetase (AMP-forming)/AMP-acid ligase II
MSSMDVNLADLVGAVADAVPDRCAVVCEGDRLSYRQLMDRSSRLARHLIASGLRPEETVGLYMLNSAAYVESLLGCMLGRLIPVNINYRYTENELARAVGWLRAQPAGRGRPVVLYGASRGAEAVLLLASYLPHLADGVGGQLPHRGR